MDFKSQIATTVEQSKILLKLVVNPKTADMYHWWEGNPYFFPYTLKLQDNVTPFKLRKGDVPAWSLSRLLEMMPKSIDEMEDTILMIEPPLIFYYDTRYKGQRHFTTNPNIFNNCIRTIGWLIRNGYFNKEYLIDNEQ